MIAISRYLIFLCFLGTMSAYAESRAYIHELYSDLHTFAEKMQVDLGLHTNCIHINYKETIDKIDLCFTAKHRATIDEARAIALYIINQVVKNLNEQDRYRPYFKEFPFSHKLVSLELSFMWTEGDFCDGSVSNMRKVHGSSDLEDQNMLYYYACDPFTEKGIDLYEEHYEDAMEKLASSSLKFPYAHKTTDLEAAMDQIFIKYSDDMCREKRLLRRSIGGLLSGNVEKLGVIFTCHHPTHLQQGREMLTYATERLIKAINESEKLKPYLLEKPFSDKRVMMEIRFCDDNFLNFHDGSLDSIVLDNSHVTYFHEEHAPQEDFPDLKDVRPFVWESYQEALEKSRKKA